MAGKIHQFAAVAFEENLSLRELVPAYPGARAGVREMQVVVEGGGELSVYPLGAIVLHDVPLERRGVDGFSGTVALVEPLEERGSAPMRTRGVHRFIGQAIGKRGEVFTVLPLLDKPDAMWDDPALDRIYDDLRAEFDLVDRYGA